MAEILDARQPRRLQRLEVGARLLELRLQGVAPALHGRARLTAPRRGVVRDPRLRGAQARIAADAGTRRNQARETAQARRDALAAQVEVARRELTALEAARLAKIAEFRNQALAASDFQKLKDDPLSRMTAYQELKNDPKDGATITLFSWMTKFLVIFLEIVPVVAKMFFSPPSVYAARIQATVNRGREEAFRPSPEPTEFAAAPLAPSPAPSHVARKPEEPPKPELRPTIITEMEDLIAAAESKSAVPERTEPPPTVLRPKAPAGYGMDDRRSAAEAKRPEPERAQSPLASLRPKPDARPQAKTGMETLKSVAEFKFPEPIQADAPEGPLSFTLEDDIPEKP